MGPVRPEKDEPVFHAPWEARVRHLPRNGCLATNGTSMPRVTHRERDRSSRLSSDELLREMVRDGCRGDDTCQDAASSRAQELAERQACERIGEGDPASHRREGSNGGAPAAPTHGGTCQRLHNLSPARTYAPVTCNPLGHTRLTSVRTWQDGEQSTAITVSSNFPDTNARFLRRTAPACVFRTLRGARTLGRSGFTARLRSILICGKTTLNTADS